MPDGCLTLEFGCKRAHVIHAVGMTTWNLGEMVTTSMAASIDASHNGFTKLGPTRG